MEDIINYKKEKTLYEILGCAESAIKEQITAEFRHRVKSCHPDKIDDKEANIKYDRLLYAYQILSDDKKRKDYDNWLASGLCITYATWLEKQKSGHTSLHFVSKNMKKTLMIESEQDPDVVDKLEKCDKINDVSPSNESNDSKENNGGRVTTYLKRSSFACGGKSGKFRKYQI